MQRSITAAPGMAKQQFWQHGIMRQSWVYKNVAQGVCARTMSMPMAASESPV